MTNHHPVTSKVIRSISEAIPWFWENVCKSDAAVVVLLIGGLVLMGTVIHDGR